MATTNDDDPQQRFALGVVFILLGLLLSTVIGTVVYQFGFKGDTAQTVATGAAGTAGSGITLDTGAAAAAAAGVTTPAGADGTGAVANAAGGSALAPEGAGVEVVDGVVKFFFATGSAEIAPGAAEALAEVIQGVAAGRQAVVSGFHDPTGNQAVNEALAKQRAETVRDVLVALGVPADRIRLEKPAETTGTGVDNAEARRVEVKLVD